MACGCIGGWRRPWLAGRCAVNGGSRRIYASMRKVGDSAH